MFYSKSLRVLYFIFLFSLCSKNVFSGLFPENVIQVGKNKYQFVGDLREGQLIATLDEKDPYHFHRTHLDNLKLNKKHSNKAVLIELTPDSGEAGLLIIGEDQVFYRQGVLDNLKSKLLSKVKRKNRRLLKILLNVIWVKAKDLRVGDKLKGNYGIVLTVTNVKNIELNKKMDFYELSLKRHYTFYLIDSSGNSVLTHNMCFIAAFVLWTAGGSAISGLLGGGYAAVKSHYNGGITKEKVFTGVKIGAAIGAGIGGAIAIGIALTPWVSAKVISFLAKHKSIAKGLSYINEHWKLISSTIAAGINYGKDKISEFLNKTSAMESEDIDFSGTDPASHVNFAV